MEKTLVLVKPDGVKRGLLGEIILRLERKGLILERARKLVLPPEMAAEHYQEHRAKSFFPALIAYISSGPVWALVWQGPNAIALARMLIGHKDPLQALPGTVRGDFACTSTENLVHASDSSAAAEREINLFFGGVFRE